MVKYGCTIPLKISIREILLILILFFVFSQLGNTYGNLSLQKGSLKIYLGKEGTWNCETLKIKKSFFSVNNPETIKL